MLQYSLVENLLTERADDYSAQTHSMASLDKEAVITRILGKGTLLTRTDVLAVLNGLEETIADALLEGYSVTLPLFNTSFSVSGVFDSPMDSFDPNRHKLNINLSKGTLLRTVEKQVKLEKTAAVAPQPQIQEVKDVMSGAVNERLTLRGAVELRGYNLRVEGANVACGVWFVMANGTEIKADVLIENKPSRVIAMLPTALKAGVYQIKVVTQYSGGGTFLKQPRVFIYPKNLTAK